MPTTPDVIAYTLRELPEQVRYAGAITARAALKCGTADILEAALQDETATAVATYAATRLGADESSARDAVTNALTGAEVSELAETFYLGFSRAMEED